MGAISIGLKTKPRGSVCVFEWDANNERQKYVAVTMSNATVYTIEEFCADYTDKEEGLKQLHEYQELGCKFVLYTRSFSYGRTKLDARNAESGDARPKPVLKEFI